MKFKKPARMQPLLDEKQRLFLKDNSKTMPIQKIAKELGITTKQAINQCTKYYLSYFSNEAA